MIIIYVSEASEGYFFHSIYPAKLVVTNGVGVCGTMVEVLSRFTKGTVVIIQVHVYRLVMPLSNLIYAQETVGRKTSDDDVTDGNGDGKLPTQRLSSAAKVYTRAYERIDTTLVTAQVMGASPNSQTTGSLYRYGVTPRWM